MTLTGVVAWVQQLQRRWAIPEPHACLAHLPQRIASATNSSRASSAASALCMKPAPPTSLSWWTCSSRQASSNRAAACPHAPVSCATAHATHPACPAIALPTMLHLQMQQCGQPPQEIVDELAPGMQVQVLPYRQSYCGGAGRTLQSPISAHQAANRPCQQPPFLPVHASSCFPTSALCAASVWAGWATDIWRRWSWGGGPAARAAGLRHSVSTRNAGRPRQAQAPPGECLCNLGLCPSICHCLRVLSFILLVLYLAANTCRQPQRRTAENMQGLLLPAVW